MGFNMLYSMPDTTNTYGENVHLTNHTYQGLQNRRHMSITQHHLDHQVQIMSNEDFTIKGHSGQLFGFIAPMYMNTLMMSFMLSNTIANKLKTPPHARRIVYEGNLLSFVMIEHTIIQAASASREMFDRTKGKYEAWTEFIKNAAQISGQNAMTIAFFTTDATGINEIKTTKKAGLCYKCRGPHFQHYCTSNSNNKCQTKTSAEQTDKATTVINFSITKPITICF